MSRSRSRSSSSSSSSSNSSNASGGGTVVVVRASTCKKIETMQLRRRLLGSRFLGFRTQDERLTLEISKRTSDFGSRQTGKLGHLCLELFLGRRFKVLDFSSLLGPVPIPYEAFHLWDVDHRKRVNVPVPGVSLRLPS